MSGKALFGKDEGCDNITYNSAVLGMCEYPL